MTNEILSAIVGAIMPPFISLMNANITNKMAKYWTTQGVCVIVGFLIVLLTKQLDWANFIASALLVMASANATYKTYFQPKAKK